MNRRFIFLASAFGLGVLIGACQPGTEPIAPPAAPSPAKPSVTLTSP